MKNKILDSLINIISKYYNYDKTKLLEIRYGLESIYLSIVKVIVIFIISYFIHTTKELCLLFLLYGTLRLTAFGLHAKKSWQCWITSLITFNLVPYLIKICVISEKIINYILPILFILICIYAPADTEKRPLINKKKRKMYKILSILIALIYSIIIFLSNSLYIKNLLFFCIFTEVILILPISYKLFGVNYNNYKTYKRKEDIK